MRMILRIALLILFVHLGLVVWTNRALYTQPFDATYWKDKYEHSQWKLPLSERTIGDDGLYLYEGYRLMHGEDPTLLNAEVPPLGKYLIGATVLALNNGHLYGLLTYVATLAVFFLLARQLLPSVSWALIATALLGLDPLLTSQATLTMLDSLQLLFLLLFFLFLIRKSHPALLGVAVGLFAETKFGILAPLLVCIGVLSLRKRPRHMRTIGVFLLSAAASYLLPYAQYFRLGHTPLDWLQVQKWIVSFYAHSNLIPTYGSAAGALLTGWAQNIFSRSWEGVLEWSPVWPIISMLAARAFWRNRKTLGLVGLFVFAAMLFYLAIPFWTRYLLLVLPFLYLGAMVASAKLSPRLLTPFLLLLLVLNAASSLRIHFPTPENTVKQFAYEWQKGLFQDMYETVTNDVQRTASRDTFFRTGLTALWEGEIESAEVTLLPTSWSRLSPAQHVPVRVVYKTRNLGEFEEYITLPVVREDGRWRIVWTWEHLLPEFAAGYHLKTTINPARRGSIIASDQKRISEDFPSYRIDITPKDVDPAQEEVMLTMIEKLFHQNITAVAFHQRYVGNNLPDLPVALATLGRPVSPQEREALVSFPGLTLTPTIGRIQGTSDIITIGFVANASFGECCSSLYSTTTYDGFEGLEKQHNEVLKGYHGGSLVILDEQGKIVRTVVSREKVDGRDVQL